MRSCHFCGSRFRANLTLEHFEHGATLAYDAGRGRLWAICEACGRWSLEPLDTRWEAIEEIDRIAEDRGRTVSSTANIAWLRTDTLKIVRIGAAVPREEAWWRYGETMLSRSRVAQRTERWGRIRDSIWMSLLAGFPLPSWRDPSVHVDRKRQKQFGDTAWPSAVACVECGTVRRGVAFQELGDLRLETSAGGGTQLCIYCAGCGRLSSRGGGLIIGAEADHLLRRVLAFHNYRGGVESDVALAASLVERAGSARAYAEGVAKQRTHLGLLAPVEALALEIGASSSHEHELLGLEAGVLERRWREEEEIAAIVDGELT